MCASFKKGYVVNLTPFSSDHGAKVFEWYYDIAYKLFFREFDSLLSLEDFKKFDNMMARAGVSLATIVDKEKGFPIGLMTFCCLKQKSGVYRVGILLDKNSQHKTYAIEAFIILGDRLYNRLGCQKLVVEYMADDTHFRRISEKGGFVFESVLKREALVDGEYKDEVRYYMTKEVYGELYGNYFEGDKFFLK